ncbi:hypothetical protein [Demequina zhanjiangensis]|uniref:Ig-like domain (Group 3) n=1 Tax=Demequina zhanjiangensis TaxID=3051659 RepID=A0ABT8FZ66_9MICO|nr:hypothetical protein [Demequina sp. SYSU T00b26]MDN4472142.1 hypothetical protein [Demequina sp. SYSU T00b26]
MKRRILTIATLALATVVLAPTAASAADWDISCPFPQNYTLTGDLDYSGISMSANCDYYVNLNGYTLRIGGVTMAPGSDATIVDTSGGGSFFSIAKYSTDAGVSIPMGSVLTIGSGVSFVATGGVDGAGIGGLSGQSAGTVVVESGATLVATGGANAAGIGGGNGGDGGTVLLEAGSDVTVTGGTSAFGAGLGGTAFGTLNVAGTLALPSGSLLIPDSEAGDEVTVTSTGLIAGPSGDETNGAALTGTGQIANSGIIALRSNLVAETLTVTDRAYAVTFDDQAGTTSMDRAFAPTFDAGYRTVPTPPSDTAWNTAADGSGDWFTSTTSLTADTFLYAVPDVFITFSAPPATTVDDGGSLTFSVAAQDHLGTPIDASAATVSSSNTADTVDGMTVTFHEPGTRTITVAYATGSTSTSVTVPTPELLPLSAPATAPAQTVATEQRDALAATGVSSTVQALLGAGSVLVVGGISLLLMQRRHG